MNGTSFNENERGLLPYPVILAATKGDPDTMKIVVQHYQSYIGADFFLGAEAHHGFNSLGIDAAVLIQFHNCSPFLFCYFDRGVGLARLPKGSERGNRPVPYHEGETCHSRSENFRR